MGPGKKPPRLPSLPGPVLQPLARGREVVIPCPTLGARKENKSGAQAQPLELKEGQTQRPGRRVQQPPRPLRECSRGEEKPAKLPVNGSSYLPTPLRSSQGTRSDVEQRSEERPRPGAPGVRYGGSGFSPRPVGEGVGERSRERRRRRGFPTTHTPPPSAFTASAKSRSACALLCGVWAVGAGLLTGSAWEGCGEMR